MKRLKCGSLPIGSWAACFGVRNAVVRWATCFGVRGAVDRRATCFGVRGAVVRQARWLGIDFKPLANINATRLQ